MRAGRRYSIEMGIVGVLLLLYVFFSVRDVPSSLYFASYLCSDDCERPTASFPLSISKLFPLADARISSSQFYCTSLPFLDSRLRSLHSFWAQFRGDERRRVREAKAILFRRSRSAPMINMYVGVTTNFGASDFHSPCTRHEHHF